MSNPTEPTTYLPVSPMRRASRQFAEYLVRKVESGKLTAADAMAEYDNYVSRKPCPHDDGGRR